MALKDNIKSIRNNLDMTLEDVSKKLNLSKPTLQRYESGVIANIPYENVEKLAEVFSVTPSQLMGWDDNKTKFNEDLVFQNYLKSLGYKIELEKIGESKEGYIEECKNEAGEVIGESFIPDEEYHSITLRKDNSTIELSEDQFKSLQESIKKSVEFELFKFMD